MVTARLPAFKLEGPRREQRCYSPLPVVSASEGTMPDPLPLDGKSLTLGDLEHVALRGRAISLAPAARERVARAHAVVERAVRERRVVYGITTGFGSFSNVVIPSEQIEQLQLNLVRSHAAGVGEPLGEPETRGLMLLRANVLAKAFSGVRPAVIDLLMAALNQGLHPVIPSQGSVGASGDLAPLAHLALCLIGEGMCRYEGHLRPAAEALRAAGLEPLTLRAKEGLALINGTQFMTAVAGLALGEALLLTRTADVIGALTLDVLKGTDVPFDERVHVARPHPGQVLSASNLRRLLAGSPLRESHRACKVIQDAYSLRCMPQVHGAARDALAYVTSTVAIELNAATDNPLVFLESGDVLSAGNFHGQPVALASDVLAVAVAELGALSERRIERLVNPAHSGLPAFLTPRGGLQSGLMLAHVTAAALASESKVLAHPASVDSIPTSAGQEDHVSMGAAAARKAAQVVANTRRILAIEAVAACQGLEHHKPLKSSPALDEVYRCVRACIPAYDEDRFLSPELEAAATLVGDGTLLAAAERVSGRID